MQTAYIVADTVAEAWLAAMQKVFFGGRRVPTEYDADASEASWDLSALVEVSHPPQAGLARPHPADTYGVMSLKGQYVAEVLDGLIDSHIGSGLSAYTYHDRLFAYKGFAAEDLKCAPPPLETDIPMPAVDQVEQVIQKLQEWITSSLAPSALGDQVEQVIQKLQEVPYSRRAQGITWRPYADPHREDPPCLQRVWARVIEGALVLETSWRSRDLFRAWGANAAAMIALQQKIAAALGVPLGPYVDFSNSLHIYGQRKVVAEVIEMFDRAIHRGAVQLSPEDFVELERRRAIYVQESSI